MISQTAEYALRAVVYVGNQHDKPCTTAQISEATDAPSSYLAKVMRRLCRAGIVDSRRGLHGGFTLTQNLDDLTILDVVNAVDALHRIRDCPLGRVSHDSELCPLHRRMDNVMAAVEKSFENITISEVLEGPGLLCNLSCISEPVVEG